MPYTMPILNPVLEGSDPVNFNGVLGLNADFTVSRPSTVFAYGGTAMSYAPDVSSPTASAANANRLFVLHPIAGDTTQNNIIPVTIPEDLLIPVGSNMLFVGINNPGPSAYYTDQELNNRLEIYPGLKVLLTKRGNIHGYVGGLPLPFYTTGVNAMACVTYIGATAFGPSGATHHEYFVSGDMT